MLMIAELSEVQMLEKIQNIELFSNIPQDALAWLVSKSECELVPEGEALFRQGDKQDHMMILVEGEYAITFVRDGRQREFAVIREGSVTGVLPFSRMVEAGASGIATKNCHVLLLHRDHFVEMTNVSYELTQVLVSVMTERVRDFQQARLTDEKMLALGKMSAGLAHELNNPAAAIVRASEILYNHLHQTPERFKSVITMPVTPEQVDEVNTILFTRLEGFTDVDLSLMEREEKLDDLVDWLEDNDIEKGDEMAENLVDFGFTEDDMDQIKEILPAEALGSVLWWIESNLNTERLVSDIKVAGDRIANLVSSIKSYSHMDQQPSMEVIDIVHGLKDTITILQHRFKKQHVELEKELNCELGKIKAIPGELNQVWTNLISNALDVLPDGGKITIRTYTERDSMCLEIIDNGPGVPEEIQNRIFEPFFTTKGVGEGTGMGLDIVKRIVDRHHGSISLESVPGRTCFRTCFPIHTA